MRRFHKEIITTLLCLVLAGGFVSYFFRYLNQEKQEVEKDVYALIPYAPLALLEIKQSDVWLKYIVDGCHQQALFGRFIPSIYFPLFRAVPSRQILFSFHLDGVICYLPATPREAKLLQHEVAEILNAYPPQKQKKEGVELFYYADKENSFFGNFYETGYWISSYNKVLLERVLQHAVSPAMADEYAAELQAMPGKSTLNLLISAEELPLQLTVGDSLVWENSYPWIQADIYNSQNRLTAFFDFQATALTDSLQTAVGDTLRNRLSHYLQISVDSCAPQSSSDEQNLYITLTYPAVTVPVP